MNDFWSLGERAGWLDAQDPQNTESAFDLPSGCTDQEKAIYEKGYQDGFTYYSEQYKQLQIRKLNLPQEEIKTENSGHIYKSIFGYFDFEEVYLEQVKKAQDGYKFVEIGCLFGKSSCFLGVEIKNSGKRITLDCIDLWTGAKIREIAPNVIFQIFNKNIAAAKIQDIVSAKRMPSEDASKLYENESIDFIFIDADHSYEGVLNDLNLWFPKLKKQRTIAGHDYSWSGARQAVNEFFGKNKIKVVGDSWIYEN